MALGLLHDEIARAAQCTELDLAPPGRAFVQAAPERHRIEQGVAARGIDFDPLRRVGRQVELRREVADVEREHVALGSDGHEARVHPLHVVDDVLQHSLSCAGYYRDGRPR